MQPKVEINPDTKLWPVGAVGKCMSSPQSYADHGRSYGKRGPRETAVFALQELERARALDVEAHEKNLPVLTANADIRARIIALMKEAGIPDTQQVPSGRTRYGRAVMKSAPAGYIDDMRRCVPIGDGFESATLTYQGLKARYDEYAKNADELEQKAQQERETAAEREKAKRKADIDLVKIILRYSLPEDSEWRDVLEALCEKDQRLDLAVAMAKTRADWSDGPDTVRYALDRFKTETAEDLAIARDVSAHVIDWDGDGRCFRDTNWNYDRLFASVTDQQLSADVQKAMGEVQDR